MTTVHVRPATEDDAPVVARILAAGSRTPDAEDVESAHDYATAIARVHAAGGEVLVACADDYVVGLCQVLLLPHVQHRGGICAEVESVHVREDWRRRGVGRALMAAAESFAVAHGCYRVQLTSHESRAGAHFFYGSLGYEPSHVGFKKPLSIGD